MKIGSLKAADLKYQASRGLVSFEAGLDSLIC